MKHDNAQGGQPRVRGVSAGSDSSQDAAHHQQQQLFGVAADVPASCAVIKPADASTQKVTPTVPRSPTSNVAASSTESTAPATPAKEEGQLPSVSSAAFGKDRLSKPLVGDSARPQKDSETSHQISATQSKIGDGNYGVSRNPLAQMRIQFAGGILPGLMQPIGPQGGVQRNGVDADRWRLATASQMPSPQTRAGILHKAVRKYEVGKVADEEDSKQRQLRAILNKLTMQNFRKLCHKAKEVNIDNVITLCGVVSQIFDKALMEPTFCETYVSFCFCLAEELPVLSVDKKKITFRRLLLNKCQEEFEKGEREEQEADTTDEEGEVKLSAEEREEKKVKARRRMLGNVRLIGELYKKRMLTERIMHECIKKLLGEYQNPDKENVEALCELMSTIGQIIDHPKAKEHIDCYFDTMERLSNNLQLSSRVRFMLKDLIDLRKNKWQQRRKVEGPKNIETGTDY